MNISAFIHLVRPKQWAKNAFVLAPLIFSFKLKSLVAVDQGLMAAIVFCLCASAIYIINDLTDIKSDRLHPKKRQRVLAAGKVTRPQALIVFFILILCGVALLFVGRFPPAFIGILSLYILLSLSYSLGLKHVPLLELFIVASGYILRLLAGCAAIDEAPSPWILAATGAIALFIAAGKRRAELAENDEPQKLRRSLKEYNLAFLDSAITILAGVTIVTYLLFTTSDYAINRFHSSYFVSTSVFVVYGILRYLQLITVTTGAEDPTTLVLTDTGLRLAGLGWLVACIGFIYF